MDNDAIRAAAIATARSLLLRDGDKFTYSSLYRVPGLNRARLRRVFPTKAALIAAVLNEFLDESRRGQSEMTPVTASDHGSSSSPDVMRVAPALGCGGPDNTANVMPSALTSLHPDDDWIEHRFRIVERAIGALEMQVDTCGSEQSNAIAALEQKLTDIGNCQTVPATIAEPPPRIVVHEFPEPCLEVKCPDELDCSPDVWSPAEPEHSPSRVRLLAILENARRLPGDSVTEEFSKYESMQFRPLALTAAAFASLLLIAGLFWSHGHARTAAAPAVAVSHAFRRPVPVALIDATGTPKPRDEIALNSPELVAQAKNGNALAQTALAEAYLRGTREGRNLLAAARWSQLAAEQGEASAQFILGTLYSDGIKPNPSLAMTWFFAAAAQGNAKAMHNLGVAFLTGQGVAKDAATAARWFGKAARLGYRDSEFDLAVLYERGEGVPQNAREALKWYDRASSAGDQEARVRAATLRANLPQLAAK